MPKEFAGLDIPDIERSSQDLESWLPHIQIPESIRPITRLSLGLIPVENGYIPLELDLLAKGITKTIFIVGDDKSKKEDLMKGILRHASGKTAQGFLTIKMSTQASDPYSLHDFNYIKRHIAAEGISRAPEGRIITKILRNTFSELTSKKSIFKSAKSYNPQILVIDDLGNFFKQAQGESKVLLGEILRYNRWRPFVTIALVNDSDLDLLKDCGVGFDDADSGFWFVGRSKSPLTAMEDYAPGYFLEWSPKRKSFGSSQIIPFT